MPRYSFTCLFMTQFLCTQIHLHICRFLTHMLLCNVCAHYFKKNRQNRKNLGKTQFLCTQINLLIRRFLTCCVALQCSQMRRTPLDLAESNSKEEDRECCGGTGRRGTLSYRNSCNRAATELQQICNRSATDLQQSCNRAATELQQLRGAKL